MKSTIFCLYTKMEKILTLILISKNSFRYYKENRGNRTVIENSINLIKDKEFVSLTRVKQMKQLIEVVQATFIIH